MSPEPGLYVHVPFCSSICPYCDFAVTLAHRERQSRFVESLLTEIASIDKAPGKCDTLYFGGGTPSLLPLEDLERLRQALEERDWLATSCRISLEANPEDVSPASVESWRRLGVETLSLGVQSFDDGTLKRLGRRHPASGARRAVELAAEAGFPTVSIDLIYGLPGQEPEEWSRELRKAAALPVQHLSCYQLTIHKDTRFGRERAAGRLEEASDELQGELFRVTHQVLSELGFEGYEVSNFARDPRHRSRHNQKYWSHVPYLGLGPSAHSFDGRSRFWNERSFFRWRARLARGDRPVAGEETLGDDALLLETLMLRLRTREGVDLEAFRRRFGFELRETHRDVVDRLVAQGLLVVEPGRLRPTLDGLAVADGLASAFEFPFDR